MLFPSYFGIESVSYGKEPLVELVNDWRSDASANSLDSEKESGEGKQPRAVRILKDPNTGRFVKGTGGHGRYRGSVSSVTKARAILADHTEELIGLALEQVRQGKATALLAELLKFSMPTARSQLMNVQIPAAEAAMAVGDFDGALAAVTQSVLAGDTSPDSAKVLTDQIRAAEEAKRYRQLSEEVEKLSQKVIEGQARRIS